MSEKQILKQSIDKAKANGFDFSEGSFSKEDVEYKQYFYVIFDHDFAKAFFKDQEWEWTHYLQQMVIKENPIQYLEQFLDNPKGLTV